MSACMTWPEMETNMQRIGELQAAVKERAMIFNVVEKEFAARMFGLPLASFYDLPFVQWVDVHRAYSAACRGAIDSRATD